MPYIGTAIYIPLLATRFKNLFYHIIMKRFQTLYHVLMGAGFKDFKIKPFINSSQMISKKMAHHVSLRLPGIKLRKHSARGPCQREIIHPYCSISQSQEIEESKKSDEAFPGSDTDLSYSEMDPRGGAGSCGDIIDGPSMYKIQQDAAASGWEKIRSSLLRDVVEANVMPPEQRCVNEPCAARATLRCQKCGLSSFYCPDCFIDIHAHSNFFHVAKEWKVLIISLLLT